MVMPQEGRFAKKLIKVMENMRKGSGLKEAYEEVNKDLFGQMADMIKQMAFGKKDDPSMKPEFQALSAHREDQINFLKTKIARPIMKVNIRLVASAQTQDRADAVLEQMKAMFDHFSQPQANAYQFFKIEGRRQKGFFFDYSFRLFNDNYFIYLNTAELASLFHFPTFELSAPRVKFLKLKRVMPPSNLPKEGLVLGKSVVRSANVPVCLSLDDRRRHLYTIGQTGTGKTAFMKNLIMQDIRAGEGLCFIDPHGDTVDDILGLIPPERWEDVIYFNPGDINNPMGLNMLEYDERFPEQKTLIVNELLEIFDKLFNMSVAGGPMFEQYFRNSALLVMDDPDSGSTLLEIARIFSSPDFRKLKLSKCKNEMIKSFWRDVAEKAGGDASLQNMVPYITSKFDNFLTNEIMRPIICQQKSAFNFRDIIDNQKIFLVNLSKGRLGETNAYLLGMILVGRLTMAAMGRADIVEERRKDFYLYIDEFQNVTTKSIAVVLSEARKYRLALTVAHQFIAQMQEEIKKAVFGNVGSMAVFRVGTEDAEFLAKYFEPVFTADDLVTIPNYNAYVKLLLGGESGAPFNMETLVPEKGDPAMAEKVRQLVAVKYARPRSVVEEEIQHRYTQSMIKQAAQDSKSQAQVGYDKP